MSSALLFNSWSVRKQHLVSGHFLALLLQVCFLPLMGKSVASAVKCLSTILVDVDDDAHVNEGDNHVVKR